MSSRIVILLLAACGAPSVPEHTENEAPPEQEPVEPAEPIEEVPTKQAPHDPPRDALRVFYIGHSLQNWTVPTMVQSFARAQNLGHEYQAQIGNGASLRWQWDRPDRAEGVNAQEVLPRTPFDALVVTEAVPLDENVRWNEPASFFRRFLELARRSNPDVQGYLYETWHSRNEPRWRERLDTDRATWESIADQVNAAYEGRDVLVIPGGQAMALLHDRVRAGAVPGVRSMDAIFHDDIHLTPLGWYFISCVQYATLYRRSPIGLPARTTDRYGGEHPSPPAEALSALQNIAWDAVRAYPRSGVR